MDNYHSATNGHSRDRHNQQRYLSRSEQAKYPTSQTSTSSYGYAGDVSGGSSTGRRSYLDHDFVTRSRGLEHSDQLGPPHGNARSNPLSEYDARSSGAGSVSDAIAVNKIRKDASLIFKDIFGYDPDDKALEKINAFASTDSDKRNIGVETRAMERLKIHLIKQGREDDAKRLEKLYKELKATSVLKNREAIIQLMYYLFDREKTRAIVNKEKVPSHLSKRTGHSVNFTEEKMSAIAEVCGTDGRGGRNYPVILKVEISDIITNTHSSRKNTPASPVASVDKDMSLGASAGVSMIGDLDPMPIPNLHRSSDNQLSKDTVGDTKVPVLVKTREPQGLAQTILEDIPRGVEYSALHSVSRISKCKEEPPRNLLTQMSFMGSSPSVFSSTPVSQTQTGSAARQKPFVNLRNVQDHRGGSPRSASAGTAQTFGNMKAVERDLIRDIIFIIQGIDGQYIKANPNGTFDIDKKLVVHPAIRMQTLKLCEMGFCYTIIRNYCDKPISGLVAQGFKHSIEREMQEFYRWLAIIQSKIQQTIVDTPMSEDLPSKQFEDMSLLKLGIFLFDCRTRLQVLSGMVNACVDRKGGDLCSSIYKYSMHGDPLVSSLAVSILSVVCKPLYITLSQWILYGELEDPFNEFFIAADPACKKEHLWHLKYEIRTKMLPSFISKKQAEKILAIGKNINFLKEICNNAEGFEGRYEIKALLETGEVESLFVGENSPIQYAIEMAYKTTSEKVLKVLIDDSKLLDHLKAIKKYLLLGQGDFIQYFLELIQDELSKPASKLYNHNISAILDSAVRATNAQFENEDVLNRLDHRILPTSEKDVGWDVFCLDYKVHGPIGTVLTEDVMTSYNKLFNGLWRTKRIEIILSTLWKNQTVLFKYLRLIPELAPVLHRSQLLISEMIHFVHQTQYYIMFEATECAWEKLMEDVNKASDLDEVISSHQKFLDTIFRRSLLDGESRELLNQLRGIFDSVYELRAFLSEFNDCVETEVKSRRNIEPNSAGVREAQKKFFTSCVKKAKGKIETLYTTTQDLVRTFLLVLNKQQDLTLQCLSFRLDFNEYYHQKDSRLTLPLTFQHRRRSSVAIHSGNMSGSFTMLGNSTLCSSSIQEMGES